MKLLQEISIDELEPSAREALKETLEDNESTDYPGRWGLEYDPDPIRDHGPLPVDMVIRRILRC